MVSNARTSRTRLPWIALGAVAALVATTWAPLAAAQESAPADARPIDRPRCERCHGFDVSLAGTAVSQDNVTYAIEIVGSGKARARGDDAGYVGRARLDVTLYNADGTVAKEGRLVALVRIGQNEEGAWHWGLVGCPRNFVCFPHLALRGTAVAAEGLDGFALEGHGKGKTKLGDDDERTRLRIEVSGALTPK